MQKKKKKKKNGENVFRFWDKYIWKCCNKLPLLRREHFSSAVNGLRKSPKILHTSHVDFLNPIFFTGINKYGKGAVVQISTVFRSVYHVTCPMVPWKGTSYTFIEQCFSESVSLKIHELGGSSFFWKCSEMNLTLENVKKNSRNIFGFWDSCIWICSNKLPLLRRVFFYRHGMGSETVLRFWISLRKWF